MEKFLKNLQKAEATIKTCDHLIYMTFPLVKDKKLLLKILRELKNAVSNCINAILQYEYLYKRIKLFQNQKANLTTFNEKCAKRYLLNENDLKKIKELFFIAEQHEKSPFEFSRNGEIVILSEHMEKTTINVEKIKSFLELSKKILENVKRAILRKI
jgi:hypothetical protein